MIIVADTDNRDRGLGSTPSRTQTKALSTRVI